MSSRMAAATAIQRSPPTVTIAATLAPSADTLSAEISEASGQAPVMVRGAASGPVATTADGTFDGTVQV